MMRIVEGFKKSLIAGALVCSALSCGGDGEESTIEAKMSDGEGGKKKVEVTLKLNEKDKEDAKKIVLRKKGGTKNLATSKDGDEKKATVTLEFTPNAPTTTETPSAGGEAAASAEVEYHVYVLDGAKKTLVECKVEK